MKDNLKCTVALLCFILLIIGISCTSVQHYLSLIVTVFMRNAPKVESIPTIWKPYFYFEVLQENDLHLYLYSFYWYSNLIFQGSPMLFSTTQWRMIYTQRNRWVFNVEFILILPVFRIRIRPIRIWNFNVHTLRYKCFSPTKQCLGSWQALDL